ncbi:MAG TPA: PqqD family protein [Vicinamibacteria bacterium]
MKPEKRTEGLVVTELMDEVLVYDLERHRAHCLNRTAAIVFKHCDGTRTVGELAGLLERETGAHVDSDCVWLALDRLGQAQLLRQRVKRPKESGRLSRRELVRRIGIAALLPVVTSIVAPTPAQAAASCVSDCTGQPFGTPCSSTAPANCLCTCNGAGACIGGC